ncbi:hypothetical protein C8N35_1011392 [Breoghania corrubedonensis]|uniref:Inner membrane protein n=1 Tax=Breoghania corrubedonensis TaxID=665038 RepID=A0A2T5VHV6_9HYPH|nr:mitofilin family membrane protein [Breoghania corrubedonensis]PTW63341.1 hypothetical protein C8N35_1011392 [Breoghania corrubedonensis]
MASEKDKTSSENAKSDEKAGTRPGGTRPGGSTAAGGAGSGAKPAGQGASQGSQGESRNAGAGATKPGGTQTSSSKPGNGKPGSAQSGASGSSATGAPRSGKPLTIDLTAEEVRSKQQAQANAEGKAGSRGSSDQVGSSSKPSGEGGRSSGSAAASRPSTAHSKAESSGAKGAFGFGGIVLAAGIGAVVAFGGVWGAGKAGLLTFSSGQELENLKAGLASTDGRFAALDERMREISKTEAVPTVAPSVVNDMAARLQDLEERTQAEAGLQSDVKSISNGLDELRRFVSSGGAGSSAALASLGDSVEKLQGQVEEITGKVGKLEDGTSPAVTKALDDLNQKVAALDGRTKAASEAASAAAKAANEGDAVVGDTMKAFSSRLDALAGTLDVSKKQLEAQSARLGTLEGAADSARKEIAAAKEQISALEQRIAEIEHVMGGPGARETASRAIAVSLLKSAVDAGRSYTSELAAVRSALPPETDFHALEANATTGIKTETELISSFPNVAARMASTLERVDTGNSVADKFLNNMRSLVQVRATGDGAGSGPMGALGRMEESVRNGNLDQALKIYETLPDGTQNAGKDWAASARARLAADALVDKVTAEVIKALAKDS